MRKGILTLEEFQNKFKIKTNFLYYQQLIAAIPSDLEKKAATIEIPSQRVLNTAKLSSSAIASGSALPLQQPQLVCHLR